MGEMTIAKAILILALYIVLESLITGCLVDQILGIKRNWRLLIHDTLNSAFAIGFFILCVVVFLA